MSSMCVVKRHLLQPEWPTPFKESQCIDMPSQPPSEPPFRAPSPWREPLSSPQRKEEPRKGAGKNTGTLHFRVTLMLPRKDVGQGQVEVPAPSEQSIASFSMFLLACCFGGATSGMCQSNSSSPLFLSFKEHAQNESIHKQRDGHVDCQSPGILSVWISPFLPPFHHQIHVW